MKTLALTVALAVVALCCCPESLYAQGARKMQPEGSPDPCSDSLFPRQASVIPLVIGVYADSPEQLAHVVFLTESLRTFGGRFSDALVRVYVPESIAFGQDSLITILESWGACVVSIRIPSEMARWPYAGKVYAAARAETETSGQAMLLVWLDEDTIFLREPSAFMLAPAVSFAYRPVMHNRSGSRYDQPPDSFWGQVYEVLKLGDETLFPVITPADHQTIRAYFNAGLIVVRPERGMLRRWPEAFRMLCSDSAVAAMCEADDTKRIFLHQVALLGPVLGEVARDEMAELPDQYNYPIFFDQMYGGDNEFDTIEGIVTLRYETYFRNPHPEWIKRIRGASDKIEWLAERLGKGNQLRAD